MNRYAITWIVPLLTMLLMGADAPQAELRTGKPLLAPPAPQGFDDMLADHRRGILGGPHDFTRFGGNACSACHIPHLQALRPTTQPSSQPAAEMYRIAGQRKVFVPDRYTPGPASLICLGCHDGTVATSTIGASHSMLAGVREGFAVPEGFVWRDHPIGVRYPMDWHGYHPEAFVVKQKIRLPEGRIECISCHDPHNVAGINHMLWLANRRSALCLTCHIK